MKEIRTCSKLSLLFFAYITVFPDESDKRGVALRPNVASQVVESARFAGAAGEGVLDRVPTLDLGDRHAVLDGRDHVCLLYAIGVHEAGTADGSEVVGKPRLFGGYERLIASVCVFAI